MLTTIDSKRYIATIEERKTEILNGAIAPMLENKQWTNRLIDWQQSTLQLIQIGTPMSQLLHDAQSLLSQRLDQGNMLIILLLHISRRFRLHIRPNKLKELNNRHANSPHLLRIARIHLVQQGWNAHQQTCSVLICHFITRRSVRLPTLN